MVILRGDNPQDRMSAMGQKRTLEHLRAMSALPPESGHRNRPAYDLRRTNSGSLAIFAAIRRASSHVRQLRASLAFSSFTNYAPDVVEALFILLPRFGVSLSKTREQKPQPFAVILHAALMFVG